jgi:ADP-ribosylglycohydrolase
MNSENALRARGCLLGLAVGDALGGPTEGKTPDAIARQWGRVTDFLSNEQTGSDDTEYALFNAKLLLKHGTQLSARLIAEAWKSDIVSTANAYKGAGFSEMLAIRNLKSGLMPPQSGQHLHSWSDGLAMRVAPFGIVAAGRPHLAARLAAMDGSVTHAGEGIFAGQAVAAAIACALETKSLDEVIEAARKAIPADSWTRWAIDHAVIIGTSYTDVWSALGPLYAGIAKKTYYWSDLAPEAVGLAFGVVTAARGNFRETVLGGVNLGRDTDTIAAIAGAIVGALKGVDVIPAEWIRRVDRSRGICLGAVKGMSIEQTADDLAAAAERWK